MNTNEIRNNGNIAEKPLTGVRVLDLTQAYSGPFCTMHLADQGAEVIKIEVPGTGDQTRNWEPLEGQASGYFSYINRNKLGMTLNLKTTEGVEIFKELVKTADVVCENFRVGTMEKLGLGYDVLKEINPRLIYASISGFGLEGPEAARPCYDVVAQAMGGMMSMTGPEGGEMVKVGPAIADNYSGTYLSLGIAMALFQRERTGMGRRLDVSMVDTVFSILETGVVQYTIQGVIAKPEGNRDPVIAPFDAFRAKDGMFVMACGTDKFWQALCGAMGKPELAQDPRFINNAARVENYIPTLKEIIEDWSMGLEIDRLETLICEAGVPFGRIQNLQQACESELIKRRSMLWKVYDPAFGREISFPGTPIKMHGCQDKPERPAPLLGQHSEDILANMLHKDKAEISRLKAEKVI